MTWKRLVIPLAILLAIFAMLLLSRASRPPAARTAPNDKVRKYTADKTVPSFVISPPTIADVAQQDTDSGRRNDSGTVTRHLNLYTHRLVTVRTLMSKPIADFDPHLAPV